MSESYSPASVAVRSKVNYAWIILTVCTMVLLVTSGINYSYSVFFKPLASYFNWDRATVSAVYSIYQVVKGAAAIAIGWLADRFGPVKLMVFCGAMCGLGLVLTSRVNALWQIYLTFGLIEAIGMSGSFAIGSALVARWFNRKRGMALGIFSGGTGLGTLIMVPLAERLISAYGWAETFFVFGNFAWVFIVATAFLLRLPPQQQPVIKTAVEPSDSPKGKSTMDIPQPDKTLKMALRTRKLWIMLAVFFLFSYCLQTIMVHLVNYATDVGISPLVAATFISTIGAISVAGRVLMGMSSDRMGSSNSILLSCALLAIPLIWLPFVKSTWAFYAFAVIFGFAYGAEVPLIPMYIGQHFGTKALAALVGLNLCVSNIAGALGPWVSGKIFDITQSYQLAFWIIAVASVGSFLIALLLNKFSKLSR